VSIKDLCLGVLTFGNASSYDLKKFFQPSFSHFYTAVYGSIYPALAKLTPAGLVSRQPQARGRTASSIALRSRDHVDFARGLPATQPR